MGIFVIVFEQSIVPCKHLLECMRLKQLVKLAALAEIMSPTNQKHIFDLAWLTLQSSFMLKSMGILDPDWEWTRREKYVFSSGAQYELVKCSHHT